MLKYRDFKKYKAVLKKAAIFLFAVIIGLGSNLSGFIDIVPSMSLEVEAASSIIGNNEMRGVWIASVDNINFPSKPGLSSSELKAEIDDIIKTCKEANLNAIFFQVRPTSDALYDSAIFPLSKYLVTKQGDVLPGGFDPLKYIIQQAHANNIELHAWLNPYRITYDSHNIEALAPNNPARKNPSWVVKHTDGKMYYNPALPEVRQLIIDGVMEIVKKYDVDGIHFDDYFYPSKTFDDDAAYAKYGSGYSNIGDFRRANVNKLVSDTYNAIKKEKSSVRFGISPCGIWANKSTRSPTGSDTSGFEGYHDIFADSKAWVEGGYIDYICPQIYWSFDRVAARFDIVTRWWSAVVDGTGVDLYIGQAAYQVPAWESEVELAQQIEFARACMGVAGSVFYGYKQIKANSYNTKDTLAKLFASPRAVPKPKDNGKGIEFGRPASGVTISGSSVNIMGSSNPLYPVYYNGQKVTRTKSGFFTVYAPLQSGKNSINFVSNGKTYTHTVNKKASAAMLEPGFSDSPDFSRFSNAVLMKDNNINNISRENMFAPAIAAVQNASSQKYSPVEVIKDYTPFKIAADSDSYDDYMYASVGMRDNVVAVKGNYYQLGCGAFVPIANVAELSGRVLFTNRIFSAATANKGGVTEIRFAVTENVPVDALCKDGVFRLTLFNTPEGARSMTLGDNPIFKSVKTSSDKTKKTATYTFELKHPDNWYGFEVVYEGGFIIVKVKNPMKKIEGDKPLAGLTIILDAGHGGSDHGALGYLANKSEKDLNLEIVMALKPKLIALGANIVTIRETDVRIETPSERMEMFNKINPDLMISVHHNSMDDGQDNTRIKGYLGLYKNDSGRLLTKSMSRVIALELNRYERTPREQNVGVLRNHKFPSTLLEMSFITNPEEYEVAVSAEGVRRSADAIAKGVVAWIDDQQKWVK